MLAQLKTVVLVKEAIKLAFRLVEYLERQHLWVQLQAQNGEKYSSVYSMRGIAKKLKISYNAVYYSLHITAQTGSN